MAPQKANLSCKEPVAMGAVAAAGAAARGRDKTAASLIALAHR